MKPGLDARNQQASDPEASVWVTANAGSGKTYLLVDRIIRLLLAGTAPSRILCLTFTKAAASEMSRRLFDRLSGWIAMADEDLGQAIEKMTGHRRFSNEAARRLFAEALETPGGLKIQTIHAFCERLLQRFPLEAGVVPGFSVLDDQGADELLAQSRRAVLDEAQSEENTALAQALATVVARAGEDAFDGLLGELLDQPGMVLALPPGRPLFLKLSDALKLREDETPAAIRENWHAARDAGRWRDLARLMLDAKTKTDRELGAEAEIIARSAKPQEAWTAARAIFLTSAGDPRKNLLTKKLGEDNPALLSFAEDERARFEAALNAEASAICRESTFALLTLAHEILSRFEAEKRRLGLYGYDDLIARARALLRNAAGDWVLYKLDGGLDHVLIDEAQDTSPEQWDVIGNLTREFFAGEGARPGITRTIFVVGDEKQSIYSFQGADPARFDEMKQAFLEAVRDAGQEFRNVPLGVSFRSTAPVLQAVDLVWNREGRAPVAHQAVRAGERGLVELWPPYFKEAQDKRDPWRAPGAEMMKASAHPRQALARRIAKTIRHWIEKGEMLEARGRPITPGDVLILLRSRGGGPAGFMNSIIASLKQEGLPVAGADRLALASHIGVLDLMALARFVLNTADDLSLAAILKSPLFAKPSGAPYTDEDLMQAAMGRGSQSLWAALGRAPGFEAPAAQLHEWLALAAESPFNFFSRVLYADGAYGRFLARLGGEAAEPLDAFMAKCLDFEADHTPSLGRFIIWLEEGASEIKREMGAGVGEIRVMTVHGSKGLEANVVILPDTCEPPDGKQRAGIYYLNGLPLWRAAGAERAPAIDQLEREAAQAAQEEYARLLYVAMTRASDRLYIAGAPQSKDKVRAGSWYEKITDALKPAMEEAQDFAGRPVWRLANTQDDPAAPKPAASLPPPARLAPPAWAREIPKPESSRVWLPPSKIGAGEETAQNPQGPGSAHRYKRGTIIHTLLQYLPELDPASREDACRRYLARKGLALTPAEIGQITGEVMHLLTHPDFAAVFAPGSLAEVPLAAFLGEGQGLSGRMDRIAVTASEVLILDYKTNRPPPVRLEDVPAQYLAQMQAYRQALTPLFPDHRIRTALIWTDAARFMELP